MTWRTPMASVLAAGMFAASALGTAAAAADSPPIALSTSEGGTLPIAATEKVYAESADLYGEVARTGIALYADLAATREPIRWRLAADGRTLFAMMQPEDALYGKDAEVKLADLTGDGLPEVLIYRNGIGSGGAQGLSVYRPADGWKPLLELVDPRLKGSAGKDRYAVSYLGGGELAFEDKTTKLKGTIKLDVRRYDEDQAKSEAAFRKIEAWVDPVSGYGLGDDEGDGVLEITAVQRVIGVSHPDTIARIETKYKLKDGAYVQVAETLCDAEGHPLQAVEIPGY
ncbi:hypothetical protein [Cohnella nanjingensis]|uniref:VCBS repeat-containing protein n=1 Tax=Cohnella nanjingensis TaxID=1387779 RepID=A0A7X0RQD3_9BACL|nr:hypothetical protein [Cohnella nanjingensis]MBB6670561.1 hypothetical protein [Cohnella nanjingensis]